MNKIKLLLLILTFTSCNSNNSITDVKTDKQNIDLGLLVIGDTINKSIFIKNIGEYEFKIDSVGVSCGCTIADYSKFPVSKNESAEVKIKFIPEEKGKFKKSIVVEANTNPPFNIFYLKGEVK